MQLPPPITSDNPFRTAVRAHFREPEAQTVARLLPYAELDGLTRRKVHDRAYELAGVIREAAQANTNIQDLLNEFALSTQEGVVLMCLAEALLRVPDDTTADRLIRDKLLSGDWSAHLGKQDSLFVNASAWGLLLSGKVVGFNREQWEPNWQLLKRLIGRLGEPVIRAAMRQAMRIMGTQFVLGRTIEEALERARSSEKMGYRYSYDMLGEAARTMADAEQYWQAYRDAISALGQVSGNRDPIESPGISVKLSALHPRYEYAQAQRVVSELVPRVKSLALLAKQANIGFTIDAEEATRLDLSLDIIEQLFSDPDLDGWDGFGIAVQSYQKRSLDVINWVLELCRGRTKKMMVRLVKGAYWDTEIKLSQVDGLTDYPVFTRKAATDLSYQACARVLLDNRALVYPQFATHNAYTAAMVLELAGDTGGYEFQRLHGMGDGLYDYLIDSHRVPCRIYAPVGEHEHLLAYLVRRLLENGANTSFVNNIVDESITIESLVEDPVAKVKGWAVKPNPRIPLPAQLYGNERLNSSGVDLTDATQLQEIASQVNAWCGAHINPTPQPLDDTFSHSINPANTAELLGRAKITGSADFSAMLDCAVSAFDRWAARPLPERTGVLERLADSLEQHRDELIALCIKEAGKTLKDAVAEIREAVDFCRYYALQARQIAAQQGDRLQPRGVILCISPWNFPLAIFLGQISAALAAGNAVIAKPAEQTVLIAQRALELMEEAGFPENMVQLVNCPGSLVGELMIPDRRINGVMFTGSTATGAGIARTLAQRDGERIPLIAETGGQNCMLVDSTALPEQVVDDVIASGFQSAGQRCSALRVLFLQEEIADKMIAMLIGAMRELRVGDPMRLATDVGPVIDAAALSRLKDHVVYMQGRGELLCQCDLQEECDKGLFFAPRLYEIEGIDRLRDEVFGPVVHVVRYRAQELEQTLAAVNSTGFGLTFGIHSRIQNTADKAAAAVRAGNIYVNRNTIGAVVGVQPFGGHGLSGTGPKAGGPSYLYRLMRDSNNEMTSVPGFKLPERTGKPGLPDWIGQLSRQLPQWQKLTVAERQQELRQAGAEQPGIALQDSKAQLSALCDSPVILPGPTGEQNLLFHEPRGVLLCITETAAVNQQIVTALLAGNAVLHLSLQEPGVQKKTPALDGYRFAGRADCTLLQELLSSEPVAGVMVEGPQELAETVDRLLCRHPGPLLPLITELCEPLLSKRVLLEKVVSTNTTAAGGNASLLAMADG